MRAIDASNWNYMYMYRLAFNLLHPFHKRMKEQIEMQCSECDCCWWCWFFCGFHHQEFEQRETVNFDRQCAFFARIRTDRIYSQIHTHALTMYEWWCFMRLIRFVDHHLVHPLTQSHTFAPPTVLICTHCVWLFQFLSLPCQLTGTSCVCVRACKCLFDDGCTSWHCTNIQTHNSITYYLDDGKTNFTMYSGVSCSNLVHCCLFFCILR